ncbi:MAG: DNA repair exonuclease [Planctomycetota bacterium]
MFKFVHAADLHLDSPFKGITADSESVAATLRSATFDAYNALVALCVEREADFLVVAGDVYDGADRSLRAQLCFRDGLARLAQHGIRAFVVHGNHDPLDGWASAIAWPDGVHIFSGDDVETVPLERRGRVVAAVSGISYRTRRESRKLFSHFHATQPDLFQIGLLHCNCGGNVAHEDYVPCQPDDLAQVGLSYWALGHVHTRAVLNENPHIVYPGNTQGRSIREPGERGCYLVTVDDGGRLELEFCPLQAVQWLTDEVSIDGLETIDALDRALLGTVEDLRERGGGGPVICRLALTGRGPLYRELVSDGGLAELQSRARESGLSATPIVWVQEVEMAARPAVDLADLRDARDLLGQALLIAQEIQGAADLPEILQPTLAELFDDPRARKALQALSPEKLKRLLSDAELLCVDMLTRDE